MKWSFSYYQNSKTHICTRLYADPVNSSPISIESNDKVYGSKSLTHKNFLYRKGYNVGIIGTGEVGVACASSLIHRDIASSIYMFDINQAKVEGVVMDLEDEAFLKRTQIEYQPLNYFRNCNVIIITAGVKQNPGEPRTELIMRNAKILKSIIDELGPLNPNTILLIVANPVDILTALAHKWTENMLLSTNVIGTGTYLDTQRLRVAVSKKLGISPRSVHAYVLGEHGDSQVVPRSIVHIGGTSFYDLGLAEEEFEELVHETRNKAYEIISRIRFTSHGIGECVAEICKNILHDENRVMCVSVYHPKFDSHIGWPAVIGNTGIKKIFNLELNENELAQIQQSAYIIQNISKTIMSSHDIL